MVSRTNKFRGRSRYHGRGKKAGRGAGLRGGRGNAGINKHRLMTRLKYMPGQWGMHRCSGPPKWSNVNVRIKRMQVSQMAEGDSIDLTEMGYDKLLGSGRIDRALNISVASASARAIEKVAAAGGSVNLSDDDDEECEQWEEE